MCMVRGSVSHQNISKKGSRAKVMTCTDASGLGFRLFGQAVNPEGSAPEDGKATSEDNQIDVEVHRLLEVRVHGSVVWYMLRLLQHLCVCHVVKCF